MVSGRVGELLGFDGLLAAERLTGVSYKESEDTGLLGLSLMRSKSAELERELRASGDTFRGMLWVDALGVFVDAGFHSVHEWEFKCEWGDVERGCLFLDEGLRVIVVVTSFRGKLNSALMYYEVVLHKWSKFGSAGFLEGGWLSDDGVWIGESDVREGFKYKLAGLCDVGDFVPVRDWENVVTLMMAYGRDSGVEVEAFGGLPDWLKEHVKPFVRLV